MRSLTLGALAGSAALTVSTLLTAPVGATTDIAAVPFSAKAPDSAFTAASAAAGPAACTRPDGRVSATIHCYTPDQIRAFYGLAPLTADTNDGAGQTIVLVDSYGSPTAAQDLSAFASQFNGPTPSFEAVYPFGQPGFNADGGSATGKGVGQAGPTSADGWAGEANLDVQWAYAIAPKAHLVLLGTNSAETQGVQGLTQLMNGIDWAVNAYPAGTVFSMSFGTDEDAFASPAAAKQAFDRYDQTFKRGQAEGDTFFASAGDNGSTGVERSHRATTTADHPEVSYPNVSPYVTSVGGTQVQSGWTWNPTSDVPFNADGSRNPAYFAWNAGGSSQAVWNESWADIGTGGGVSSVYGRPAFQNGVAGIVGDHRGVPDLAWNAAVNGGVLVYTSFFPAIEGPNHWQVYGGTSASSPQVAALTAIANQARAAAGKGPIGDLNAVIYSAGFDRASAFSDVVPQTYGTALSGQLKNNRMWDTLADGSVTPTSVPGFPTTSGYDLTTGWGSPYAPGYVAQLAAH